MHNTHQGCRNDFLHGGGGGGGPKSQAKQKVSTMPLKKFKADE